MLIHGLGGTPSVMEPLAVALAAQGWSVEVPLLPGHGTTPEDLVGVTWAEWLAALPACRVAIGQSMGGTLALAAGATRGVVCINALGHSDPDVVLEGEWFDAGSPDIRAADVIDDAYDRLPVSTMREMMRGVESLDLAAITVPVLVVTSADDAVLDPYHSDVIASSVCGPVERLRLPRSGHVATLDLDAPMLIDAVVTWVDARLR